MRFFNIFHMFYRCFLAKLPCLALGHFSVPLPKGMEIGLQEAEKVRLTCQLGELCDIYGRCHKLPAGLM
jgi:hypothetical protein